MRVLPAGGLEKEGDVMLTVINGVLLVMALVVVFWGVKLLLNRGA